MAADDLLAAAEPHKHTHTHTVMMVCVCVCVGPLQGLVTLTLNVLLISSPSAPRSLTLSRSVSTSLGGNSQEMVVLVIKCVNTRKHVDAFSSTIFHPAVFAVSH